MIVVRRLVKIHGLNALQPGDGVLQTGRLAVRDVRHHYLGRAIGGELVLHNAEGLFRLGIIRQILGQIVLYVDPAG